MENTPDISSEEELFELLEEGKISESEYEELLEAMRKSPASELQGPANVLRKRFWQISIVTIVVTVIVLLIAAIVVRSRHIDLVIGRDSLQVRPYWEGELHCACVSILNTGNAVSPKFRFYFYLRGLDQLEAVGHDAGPIKAGDIWNAMSAPFTLKEGVNEIVVVLDPHNTVKESDETNNRASLRVVVNQGQVVETEANNVGGQ